MVLKAKASFSSEREEREMNSRADRQVERQVGVQKDKADPQ